MKLVFEKHNNTERYIFFMNKYYKNCKAQCNYIHWEKRIT